MPRTVFYRTAGSTGAYTAFTGEPPFTISGLAPGDYEVHDGLASVTRTVTAASQPGTYAVGPADTWQTYGPVSSVDVAAKTATYAGDGSTTYGGVIIPFINLVEGTLYRIQATLSASGRIRLGTTPGGVEIADFGTIPSAGGTLDKGFNGRAGGAAYLTLEKSSATPVTVVSTVKLLLG